jgi:hypothetical protein
MVRVVTGFLVVWDHGEWEYPESEPGSPYDILSRQILRLL